MSNIVRVPAATAGTVPAGGTDYQKQNDLLYAFGLWGMGTYPLDLTNNKVVKGAIFSVGGVLYKASADETITGTPSDYVKLTPISAGAQCSAAYVANLSGVTWSDTYDGYYDGSGNLHIFDEAKAYKAGAIAAPKTELGKHALNWIAADAITTPAGLVCMWTKSSIPTGWLECNGQAVSRATYATLFAVIGTTYGVGDGSTTFNVPDLRSATVRGVGTPTRFADATPVTLNQTIDDKMQTHTHPYNGSDATGNLQGGGGSYPTPHAGLTTGNNSGRTGSETTGKAVGLYYVIKA